MSRLTEQCWRNLDPWECCGQDKYCQRGCHDEGGCTNGCKVPKLYTKLARYEDLEEQCVKDNLFGLHELCDKWKAFYEDIEELLDYRKKQEQGLLIELPCKVGDVVYRFCGAKGRKYVDIRYVNSITYHLDYKGDVVWEIFTTTTDVLGKTVFLTRSEAEEALAKMGE